MCNTVGPFAELGPEVVEACLASGTHYLDTTGEQDWLITCDEKYGADFAAAGLLLSPGIAHMYTTGEIAAELCLEKPGLDTLDIAVFWGGSPTVASTLTILVNAALAGAYHLEQNRYVPWDPDAGLYQLVIPGQHELALALPWGGTSHPVWYRRDPARRQRQGARRRVQQAADDWASRRSWRRPSRRPRTCRPTSGTPRSPRPPRR